MNKYFQLFFLSLMSFTLFSQTIKIEESINLYLAEIEFGEIEILKKENHNLSKEEYIFRSKFRKELITFIRDFGESQNIEFNVDYEDVTDSMIEELYIDVFEDIENISDFELVESLTKNKISAKRFKLFIENLKRIIYNWHDISGEYVRSTWHVISEHESMVLYFYLNENNEVVEFFEDWPDI